MVLPNPNYAYHDNQEPNPSESFGIQNNTNTYETEKPHTTYILFIFFIGSLCIYIWIYCIKRNDDEDEIILDIEDDDFPDIDNFMPDAILPGGPAPIANLDRNQPNIDTGEPPPPPTYENSVAANSPPSYDSITNNTSNHNELIQNENRN
tara:strand:+ start:746 stop:1195 length:450 start_codon:yes stop_codon:yes gene_type:complete